MSYRSSYKFEPGHGWVGIIYKQGLFGRTMLTVGCMPTEQGIKLWLARVMRTRAWETASEPPDMHG